MILNCLRNPLLFNVGVALYGGSTTVLKELLRQGYVKAVCVEDYRCVPLPEAVSTDTQDPKKLQTM